MVYSRDTTSYNDDKVRKGYGSVHSGDKDYRNDKDHGGGKVMKVV
jgi:hypothetical protein